MSGESTITSTVKCYLQSIRTAVEALPVSSVTSVVHYLYEAYRAGKKV